jgi:hypothetical protein
MTFITAPAREDVFVPQDEAAAQVAAAAATERIRQEYKTKRLIINWSFASGTVTILVLGIVILGLSA